MLINFVNRLVLLFLLFECLAKTWVFLSLVK